MHHPENTGKTADFKNGYMSWVGTLSMSGGTTIFGCTAWHKNDLV